MLLIFDGDCGFCTTSAGWIERRLPDQVRVAPWQILDIETYGLSEDDVTTAAYWVDDDGMTHRGHLGIGRSLIAAGGVWQVPGQLIVRPPVSWLAKPIYGWIAKNRHKMPGATDACRVDLSAPKDGAATPSPD
ncbi:MAG: DCC1-like thiol-disulfide oxidoreductase family protein [Actinomycetota bacterium]